MSSDLNPAAGSLAPDVDPRSLHARVYRALFAPVKSYRLAHVVELTIYAVIILNVIALVLESMDEVFAAIGPALATVEIAASLVFLLEYVLRLWSVTASSEYRRPIAGRFRYALTFFAMVDLISILPLFAALAGANLKAVSVARMMRLIKLGRYSRAMQTFTAVLIGKHREVLASLLIFLVLMLMASCGIYLAEGEAQPEAFGSIPQSMWWSLTTASTVGYGDVTPITAAGKVFTGLVVLVSLFAVAIPTGIVSAGFFEEFKRIAPPVRCPHCGKSTSLH